MIDLTQSSYSTLDDLIALFELEVAADRLMPEDNEGCRNASEQAYEDGFESGCLETSKMVVRILRAIRGDKPA